ncbi:PREDICTED: NADPH-dependent diflavin oxidoreductase 1-like, partial [Merops nubicus]|uniref:NADPH-dependent diflavin oxidoreductase 1-like n=1 Tax=Merops nubicus TaxID=57421 RepID=UPI0004F0568E
EEKVYVQHRIRENRRLVWELLSSRRAHIYLSGAAQARAWLSTRAAIAGGSFMPVPRKKGPWQMPAGVAEALRSVLELEGGLSPSEAEEHLTALERSQRFQSETWS